MIRQMDNNVYTQVGIVLLIGLSTKSAILIGRKCKLTGRFYGLGCGRNCGGLR